jgi:hypothetical protein
VEKDRIDLGSINNQLDERALLQIGEEAAHGAEGRGRGPRAAGGLGWLLLRFGMLGQECKTAPLFLCR